MGKEGIPSCSSSLAPSACLSQRQESTLASSEKIFKVTVAVSDRSLLALGGGGNVFLGKALCGWSGLSPEGMHSPGPMSGLCSLTARVWEEGQRMPGLEVRLQKLARGAVKFPNTPLPGRGASILPHLLATFPITCQEASLTS